jgi:hypothetical protein
VLTDEITCSPTMRDVAIVNRPCSWLARSTFVLSTPARDKSNFTAMLAIYRTLSTGLNRKLKTNAFTQKGANNRRKERPVERQLCDTYELEIEWGRSQLQPETLNPWNYGLLRFLPANQR